MRKSLLALLVVLATFPAPLLGASNPPPPDIKGLWLTADYPDVTARAGEDARFNIALINYCLAPQLASLAIDGVPQGWTAELRGGGRQVSAAFIDYNAKANLELKIKIPGSASPQRYTLRVKASAGARTQELPLAITVEPQSEAALTAEPKLPVLRGTPRSA